MGRPSGIWSNSLPGPVGARRIPCGAATLCGGSRSKCRFSGQDRLPAREISDLAVRSAVFYRSDCDPGLLGGRKTRASGHPGRPKCRVFSVGLRPGPGGVPGGPPGGAPARPRNCRGEFHKQIVPKSSKKLPNEGPRSTPPLQRVQKAQKQEGLDRATAKTTTLSRIPAWTPPDAERQCYFFFRGARFACGRAIFCGKRRYLRGILGVLF